MIHLNNAHKRYRTDEMETLALQDVSIRIEKGEFVSIMGPSGCGKSTLLNLIGLLDSPCKGELFIDGSQITSYKDKVIAAIRNKKIGFIFQSFHLIPELSVLDNVEIPLLYRSMSSKERKKRCLAALDQMKLSARVNHKPSQLSGGQQQRVAIARAIVGQPKIILADEPTGNLDSEMGEEVMSILRDLNKQQDTTVVMVTHDEQQALQTDRIIRIFDGQTVQ
jgi:putative ABC transport system ATP-binding protein